MQNLADETTTDYPLNFPDDLTGKNASGRLLNGFKLTATTGGTSTITLDNSGANLVYRDMTGGTQASVVPGDRVNVTIDYVGHSMHGYLYVDIDQDGQFNASINADGTPGTGGEMLSYTY